MNRKEWMDHIKSLNIILFGAGDYAKRFYKDFHNNYNIIGCITNNPNETILRVDDIEVCAIGGVEATIATLPDNVFIVCASARVYEMESQLWSLGLIPGRDYCSSDMFRLIASEKKIALSYGVCYMRAIHDCLKESLSFSKDYEIYYSLSYMSRSAAEDAFLKFVVSICDLYLYNITLSLAERRKQEEVLRYLSTRAKKISIPIISSGAYHPQAGTRDKWFNPYGIVSSKTRWGSFTSPDHNVNEMLEKGFCTDAILETISDKNYYDVGWLEKRNEDDMRGYAYAESLTNIKISDYLKENRGIKRLFINESHISNDVIIEITRRILILLGYTDDLPVTSLLSIQLVNTSEVPLYPSVIQGLDLEVYKNNPKYSLFTFNGAKEVTFEEYVNLYCDYCRNMMRYLEEGFFPDARRHL